MGIKTKIQMGNRTPDLKKEMDFIELGEQLIKLEKEKNEDTKITLDYIEYLERTIRIYKKGYEQAQKETVEKVQKLKEAYFEWINRMSVDSETGDVIANKEELKKDIIMILNTIFKQASQKQKEEMK